MHLNKALISFGPAPIGVQVVECRAKVQSGRLSRLIVRRNCFFTDGDYFVQGTVTTRVENFAINRIHLASCPSVVKTRDDYVGPAPPELFVI